METIKNVSGINTNSIDGRYLMAALAIITVDVYPDKEPDTCLSILHEKQSEMFKDAFPIEEKIFIKPTFIEAITSLLNSYCRENESNTPDFILAEFLQKSLNAFDDCVERREAWYNRNNEQPTVQEI